MRWRANLPIACWLIWAFLSPRPFVGKAEISTTWRPREKSPPSSVISVSREQEFSVESQRCRGQMPAGHVRAGKSVLFVARAVDRPRFPNPQPRRNGVECGNFRQGEFMFKRWCTRLAALMLLVSGVHGAHGADDRNPLAGNAKAA